MAQENTEGKGKSSFIILLAVLLIIFIITPVKATFTNYTSERAYRYLSEVSADPTDFDSGSEFDAENLTAANSRIITAEHLEYQRTGDAVAVNKGSELIIKGSK